MKILFLLQDFPYPPDRGLRWKSCTLLKSLSVRHQCDVLCFDEKGQGVPTAGFSREFPDVHLLGFPYPPNLRDNARTRTDERGTPLHGHLPREEFAAGLRRALGRTDYDVVHIDSMNLVHYAGMIQRTKVILSVTDAISLGYFRNARSSRSVLERVAYSFAGSIIRNYERRAYKNSVIQVVSRVDQEYLQKLCPSARVEVVELAVDRTYLHDSHSFHASQKVITIPECISAPGVAKRILAFLSATRPLLPWLPGGAIIQIIGQGATPGFMRAIGRYPNVSHLARVPDFKKALKESDVCVFLEQGGAGTKNRMLQAMALGVPLVVSPAVASGIAGCNSRHFIECHTIPAFTAAVQKILLDDDLARYLGKEARRFVLAHHTPAHVAAKWERLFWTPCRPSGGILGVELSLNSSLSAPQ